MKSPAQKFGAIASAAGAPRAFTLIELLVVVAVIAVLAGIILAAMGGVQQKAARDRARGEVMALANALESMRAQNGFYPTNMGNNVVYATISGFLGSARFDTNAAGLVLDPYGNAYIYRANGTRNRATFDLYSAGMDTSSSATNDDIGNW